MNPEPIKTVEELIAYLKNFPSDCEVFYDTNPKTGGTFEYLVPSSDNDSPLNHPRNIAFISHKGW